ncbi:MAG TPA: RagB/SusD family nutrient uptake outer membrane protein, partial [Chitinophagaceae bacterium]|nr:RagB/SusD family nutrient uptake outer membrane protein [Chitinophagaceae bacterium]
GGDEVFQSGGNPSYSNTLNPPYSVSAELLALYDARPLADTGIYLADLRSRVYLQSSSYLIGIISFNPLIINFGVKFTCGSAGMGGVGLRIAEDYLNRAEAKIQKAIKAGGNPTLLQEALNDLNTLRISRYDTRMPYVQVSITDAQELLSFCRDERRREFPFDGHRWFDLRRYGMPSISHFYEENTGTGQTFTLAKGDSRYTLPIPKAVLQRNAMLTQNP